VFFWGNIQYDQKEKKKKKKKKKEEETLVGMLGKPTLPLNLSI
jgi:hypothetical protein